MTFRPWYAQDAKVAIGPTVVSVNGTQTLKTQFEAVGATEIYYTGKCKDVSITGGSRDYSKVDVLGANQLGQEERPELMQMELTLVYDESTTAQYLGGPATTTFTVTEGSTRTYNRYQYGERTTATTDKQIMAVLVVLDDRTGTVTTAQKVNSLLNNARCTNRELSLAADGHVEEKLTFKGLSLDYYEEDNFDQTTYAT